MQELDHIAVGDAEEAYDAEAEKRSEFLCTVVPLEAAIRAYLDATAPSRAPDGGVTREWLTLQIEAVKQKKSFISDAVDAILASLAASHAGDQERWRPIETAPFTYTNVFGNESDKWLEWCVLWVPDDLGGLAVVGGMDAGMWLGRDDERACWDMKEPTHWMPLPLAPAAGQDDAGEAQPQAPVMGGEG